MDITNVIIKPQISEKSQKESESGRYIFLVSPKATKASIKLAIKEIFDVEPVDVRIINYAKKKRRNSRKSFSYKHPAKGKKAIVQLKENDTINIFETPKE